MEKINIRKTIFELQVGETFVFERRQYMPDVVRSTASRLQLNYPSRKYSTTTDKLSTIVKRVS